MKQIIIFSVLVLTLAHQVFAYLDPSSGRVIAGSLWPLIVAFFASIGAFAVKYFWKSMISLFKGKVKK